MGKFYKQEETTENTRAVKWDVIFEQNEGKYLWNELYVHAYSLSKNYSRQEREHKSCWFFSSHTYLLEEKFPDFSITGFGYEMCPEGSFFIY
jgi:hypothetical protein